MDEYEEAVLFTFALLESRLDRIEYLLSGTKRQAEDKPKSFPERIQRIEKSLHELSAKTTLLNDVQQLVSKHPHLVKPKDINGENEAGLDAPQKTVLVSERAPIFATTASQLKALDDQQIPQTDGFVKLAKLRPRIAEAEDRHLQQALKISELRKRSGMLVSRVKQVQFIGQGRCFAEYQKRLTEAERTVVRTEFKHRQAKEHEG